MSKELMNTKEVAKYLDIHEKQVYLLIKAGKIPCTRVTGKWVFPVQMIEEWIKTSSRKSVRTSAEREKRYGDLLLAAGSNDPVLDMLISSIKKDYPEFHIFSANTGSTKGLEALNTGFADIAFSHLFDPETGDYNIPYLKQYCPDQSVAVVNLFHRQIGFLTTKSAGNTFRGWESLLQENVKFVNRQPGAGIRILLDNELKKRGIDCRKINGYENEVYTHFEVGLSIISGEANAGIASTAVAKIMDLHFVPLASERFDMVLDKDTFFRPAIQAFIKTLQSDRFRGRVEKIGDYNFRDAGRILYS